MCSLQYEINYCCVYNTMTKIILYGAEIFWETYELCATAVIHHSKKLGIVLSLEGSVIMTSKNRVNHGRKACLSNSIIFISSLLHKCVCFVKKGQRRLRHCNRVRNTYTGSLIMYIGSLTGSGTAHLMHKPVSPSCLQTMTAITVCLSVLIFKNLCPPQYCVFVRP